MLKFIPVLFFVIFLSACSTRPEPKVLTKEDIRLEFGVKHSNLFLTKDALSRGADPDTSGKSGTPVLVLAAVLQRHDIMKALIGSDANVNIADKNGDTPLHAAVASKTPDIVEILLKNGANPNVPGKYKRTPILEAARLGMIDNVRLLLLHKADPNAKDEFGRGVFCYAAIAPVNAIDLLKFLAGPELNIAKSDETDLRSSPLLASMKQGKPETVKYLLEQVGDFSPDSRQPLGQLAMRLAIEHNKMDWVKYLTEHGLKLNQNLPMAFKATKMVNVEGVYKFFARNGAIDKGYTPLIWAAIYKRPEIAAYLVEKGAKTGIVSNEGQDVFDYANDTATRKAIQAAEKRVNEKKPVKANPAK